MKAAPAGGGGARARSDDEFAPPKGAADGAAPARRGPGWDAPPPNEPAAANVKSGEWDDNANWREFVRYLPTAPRTNALDVSMRRFVAVVDRDGKPVPNCEVELSQGQTRVTLTTSSTGRALFFPRAEGFGPGSAQAQARCGQSQPVSVDLRQEDGLARIDLATSRELAQERVVDLVFVLDTTGSMSEEIRALVSTIERVAEMLEKEQVSMRLGLVEYKDRGDRYVTRTTPMTRDVQGFLARLREVRASGGGDLPEDMNEAVRVGVERMAWSDDSVARLAFVIADAPPHLDYGMQTPYSESAKRANHEGIVIHTVAASGMDDLGQSVFRQMAQLTGGSSMFVLRGGAGPASTGGGDPKSSCGGTQSNFRSGNLHELVRNKVWAALKAVDADPTKVAGLGRDESAVPCEQRIQQVVWQAR
jgi:Mg-chelatase subunit ChlD